MNLPNEHTRRNRLVAAIPRRPGYWEEDEHADELAQNIRFLRDEDGSLLYDSRRREAAHHSRIELNKQKNN
jgi:hypothetical protein